MGLLPDPENNPVIFCWVRAPGALTRFSGKSHENKSNITIYLFFQVGKSFEGGVRDGPTTTLVAQRSIPAIVL